MSRFEGLPPELREWLTREAPGSVIYVPAIESRTVLEGRNVRIRDAHRAHLDAGLTVRQSVRLLMVQHGLSRSQVFRAVRKLSHVLGN